MTSPREKSSFASMSPGERVRLIAGNKSISSFAKAKADPLPRRRAQEIGRIVTKALQEFEQKEKAQAAL